VGSLPAEFRGFISFDEAIGHLQGLAGGPIDGALGGDVALIANEFPLSERHDWHQPWPSPTFLATQGRFKYVGFFHQDSHAYAMRGHVFQVGETAWSVMEAEFVTAHLSTYDGDAYFNLFIQQRRLVFGLSNM
jgi:hypothetical protein